MIAEPAKWRLVLFAFGDFAFNLFWQSVMLYLLFYYTDGLDLPIKVAATTYMIASIWDGIANCIVGFLVDRYGARVRYAGLIAAGALPLGVSFALIYLPTGSTGSWLVASVLVTHLLFRTAYAAVNVPYLAMTARISPDPRDRAFVAGTRMMFGTAAAVLVAWGTAPIGKWLTGSDAVQSYFYAALLFAMVAVVILAIVGLTYVDGTNAQRPTPSDVRETISSLVRNRGFVALNVAMMSMIVAITVLSKSVLYYFKYLLNDPQAGQLALASMGAVSGVAIPLWMLVGRHVGLRSLWFVVSGLGMAGLILFAAVRIDNNLGTQIFLIGMQVISVGLNYTFWAMLPNTVEYGEQTTGLHVEGAVFGVAALVQRIGIGIATAILGWSFASAGFVPNIHQSADTLAGMHLTVTLVPLLFLILSCLAMIFNPLGRVRALAD